MAWCGVSVADIEGDDTCEIIITASYQGEVWVLKDSGYKENNIQKFKPRVVWSYKIGGKVETTPLVYDINSDNLKEIIFGGQDVDTIYALTATGYILWSYPIEIGVKGGGVAADLENNGDIEIVFTSLGGKVYVLNEMGTLDWDFEVGSTMEGGAAIGNVDGDNILDVIVGAENGKVYVIENGTLVWSPPYQTNGSIYSTPAVGNLDGDNLVDIVIGSNDGYVYAIKGNNGDLLWSVYTGGSVHHASPGLADIDKDGKLEVIMGSFEGEKLLVIEGENGDVKWSVEPGWPVPTSPAIGDIEGDGELEIVMSVHDGYCYIWDKDGEEKWTWGYNPVGDQDLPIALGDIDNDTAIEIIGGDIAKQTIYVLDFPHQIPVKVEENVRKKEKFQIKALPNKWIMFTSEAREKIEVSVYDIKGSLIKKIQKNTPFKIQVPTFGIYFCKIKTKNQIILKKIISLH
jgi:outer membrane protein assembly factor BamB